MAKLSGNKRTLSIRSNRSKPMLLMESVTRGEVTISRLYKEYLLKNGLEGNKGIN